MPTTSAAQHRLMEAAAHTPGGYDGVSQAVGEEFVKKDDTSIMRAAGTMVITARDGKALFLRRSADSDHAGEWCFPGGKVEAGETTQEAAERETREEVGAVPYGKVAEWTRQVSEGVDFTTFVAHTDAEFTPTLDHEHTAFCWAPVAGPPGPLHPGCRVALGRLTMDELGVAQAIAAGELVSPQRYGNFWLYALRITGTGLAYRAEVKGEDGKVEREAEYCWRDPSIYMTERFLQRCAGLPIIWNHTDGPKLDSEEYRTRNVGTSFVPYFKGTDEVWTVARIYDEACLGWLMDGDKSTSPGVVFSGINDNQMLTRDDGTSFLIEGVPQLLDHLAVCTNGVWDKGGAPVGVDNTNMSEDTAMADEQATAKLDAILAGMAGITSRMDAVEKDAKDRKDSEEKEKRFDSARKDRFGTRKDGESRKDYMKRHDDDESAMLDAMKDEADAEKRVKDCRMDAEERERKDGGESFEKWAKEENEEPAHRDDKARKDAEEEEAAKKDVAEMEKRETMRADQARKDAAAVENGELKTRLAAMERQVKALTTETPAAERDALARTQSRADSVAAMFGDRAPAPMPGETALAYRKRNLERFKIHSERFKDTRLDSLVDEVMTPIEDVIYHDAVAAAKRPGVSAPGVLIPITERIGGRDVTRFNGDPLAWMAPMMTTGNVGKFNREPNRSN